MRVVLSFDDGRADNYKYVVPILKREHLTATFNIATAYVDRSIEKEEVPCANEPMSIENVISIYEDGFEIACHGDQHKNDIQDIKRGYYKLKKWIGWKDDYRPGFASPRSDLKYTDIKRNMVEYERKFSYIRIMGYRKDTIFIRLIRKVAHFSHSKLLYNISFTQNIGGIKDGFVAVSVPIVHRTTINQVKAIITKAEKEENDCILMFHSILPEGMQHYNDLWSWDIKKFQELCKWLKNESNNGKCSVVKTIELLER